MSVVLVISLTLRELKAFNLRSSTNFDFLIPEVLIVALKSENLNLNLLFCVTLNKKSCL